MPLENERQLVEHAKSNPQAFGELYDHYYPKILNYVVRSTVDIPTAQDVTSQTFVKVLENIHKFKFTATGTFQAWIYRIATNELNQYFRSNKRYKFQPREDMETYYSNEIPEEDIKGAIEKIDLMNDLKILQKVMEELDEKYRNILQLRFFEKMQFNQIAEITGIKEGTLKSHMSRALEKLREKLENVPEFSAKPLPSYIILLLTVIASIISQLK